MGIAENIKRLRREHQLTQAELGRIAGVSDKAVSTWESGTAEPRMGAIQKMADYFKIPKSEIVDDNVDGPQAYYLDQQSAELAQQLFERPEMRVLFDATKNVSTDDIQFVIDMLERMKK